jgi:hypothetical protein
MDVFSYRFGPSFLTSLSSPSNSAYNFGTGAFSVEAWVKTFSGGPLIARKAQDGGSSHGGFSLSVSHQEITFMNDDGSYYNTLKSTGSDICDGKWHHVAAVRSGSTGSIYLDGVSLSTTRLGNKNPPLNVNSVDRLTIGTLDQTPGAPSLTGYLAEARIWKVARTADEIYQNFHRRLSPDEMGSNLVGYWAGEFGLAVDFSLTRNATNVTGSNKGAGKSPPLSCASPDDIRGIYSGVYVTATQAPKSSSWTPSANLTFTSQGFVVLDGSTVVNGTQIEGTSLSWPASGNSYSANIKLAVWSSNTSYWPARQERLLFEGTTKDKADKSALYRGVLAPIRVGSGALLNVGTAQVMRCINPAVGSSVTLGTASTDLRDQFCKYDVGGVVHIDSNLALKPADENAGSKILLTNPSLGGAHQSWFFEKNGTIVLKKKPNVALSAGTADNKGVRPVIIATTNLTDLNQRWLVLRDSRPVFNGLAPNAVLAGVGAADVGIRTKQDGLPEQSWYVMASSFICASTTLALTVTGGIGTKLKLEAWSAGDARQRFTYVGGRITHDISGLILVTKGDLSSGTIILADASSVGKNTQWSFSSITTSPTGSGDKSAKYIRLDSQQGELRQLSRRAAGRNKRSVLGDFTGGLSIGGLTTYVVSITTANDYGAGTNDRVEISLANRYEGKSLELKELKDSLTHSDDPFERGNKDVFALHDIDDIGQITDVTIRFANDTWYFVDHWRLVAISVTNLKWHTTSMWMVQQMKESLVAFRMDTKTTETFNMLLYPTAKYNCTMSLCKAPAQDDKGAKREWDHVWIEVVNKTEQPVIKTYFDCAGGHGGPGATMDLISGTCDRNEVVRMSTGNNIDQAHPLKPVYGTGRTDGFENAGVRARGLGAMRWDGQCHQIG